jgi:hypothetical protein
MAEQGLVDWRRGPRVAGGHAVNDAAGVGSVPHRVLGLPWAAARKAGAGAGRVCRRGGWAGPCRRGGWAGPCRRGSRAGPCRRGSRAGPCRRGGWAGDGAPRALPGPALAGPVLLRAANPGVRRHQAREQHTLARRCGHAVQPRAAPGSNRGVRRHQAPEQHRPGGGRRVRDHAPEVLAGPDAGECWWEQHRRDQGPPSRPGPPSTSPRAARPGRTRWICWWEQHRRHQGRRPRVQGAAAARTAGATTAIRPAGPARPAPCRFSRRAVEWMRRPNGGCPILEPRQALPIGAHEQRSGGGPETDAPNDQRPRRRPHHQDP